MRWMWRRLKQRWHAGRAALAPSSQAIALDGKALRGIHGEELSGVRLVAAYAAYGVETRPVLAQQRGEDLHIQRGAADRAI